MGASTGLVTRTDGATGKHGGPGRACSIARAVLVDVNRRLAGQELVVLDGARAGLAAHGALLVRPGAVRHDARGHRPVRSIRGERECHTFYPRGVFFASLGPDVPVEGSFAVARAASELARVLERNSPMKDTVRK